MLIDLAEHQNNGFIALKDIAARQGISKKYLEQIVPVLNRSDILQTNRGFQGGYKLAKSPDHYTVGQILRLTEGSLRLLVWSMSRWNASGSMTAPHFRSGRDCIKSLMSIWMELRSKICWISRKSIMRMITVSKEVLLLLREAHTFQIVKSQDCIRRRIAP